MKLFRLLSTTAATVLAIAALAVSASAMTATYDPATGKATISGIEYSAGAEQQTLLILNNNVNGTVAEADITQIGQEGTFEGVQVMVGAQADLAKSVDDANKAALAAYEAVLDAYEAALDAYEETGTQKDYDAAMVEYNKLQPALNTLTTSWKASQTYFVRVGGNGEVNGVAFDACEIKVPTTVTNLYTALPAEPTAPQPDEPEYTLGDINDDDVIDISDASAVLNAYLGNTALTDTQKLAADVAPKGAPDGVIDISDASMILNVYLGNATLQ